MDRCSARPSFRPSLRRWGVALSLVALAAGSAVTGAQDGADPLTTLGDPLELERHVSRVGDDPILAHLASDTVSSFALRLGAIRATPWLAEPERALADLARLANGDDPDLAPAAARAGQRIAARLRVDDLIAREKDPAAVVAEAAAWRTVAEDESARPDIRRLAGAVAATLSTLLGATGQ